MNFIKAFFPLLFFMVSFSGAQSLPLVITDESASDWVVDCFAGNSTSGNVFYQGPKLEVGGLNSPGIPITLANGTSYITSVPGLGEISPDGTLRLIMGEEGFLEGPIEQCAAGSPIWNLKEGSLYVTGPNCLRKIVKKSDGTEWVEVVAGIPNVAGSIDGPAKSATFPLRCLGLVCDSQGVFYWLQVDTKRPGGSLRRIKNDTVSSLPLIFADTTDGFNWAMGEGNLSRGENDNVLYISDFYNFRILKYNVLSGELTRICGVPDDSDTYSRINSNADGPALTHASANSGIRCNFDPFHNNLWVGGPDENRLRWLRLSDGWVKTVIGPGAGSWNVDGFNIPATSISTIRGFTGFDDKGGVYVISSSYRHSAWRAYNRTEVK